MTRRRFSAQFWSCNLSCIASNVTACRGDKTVTATPDVHCENSVFVHSFNGLGSLRALGWDNGIYIVKYLAKNDEAEDKVLAWHERES